MKWKNQTTGGWKQSKKGRKPALDKDGRRMVRQLYSAKEFTIRELGCVFNVSRTSILRYLQEEDV